jgi:hypothetical protein
MNKIVLALIALTAISGVGVLSSNMFSIDLQPYMIFNSFDEFTDPICTCQGLDEEGHPEYTQENCEGFSNGFSDPNQLCTAVAGLDEYGKPSPILSAQGCGVGFWKNNLDSNIDSNIAGIESENTAVWPAGYQPDYYFNDMFQTTISQPQNDPEVDITKPAKEDKNKAEKDDAEGNDDVLRVESENEEDDKVAKEDKNKAEKDDAEGNDDVLRVESENEEGVKDNVEDKGPTLEEALNARGGDMNTLLRQSVAAMLNAAHPEINYPYSVVQIIELTQISIINEDYQKTIEMFERYNEELTKPAMCLE